MSDAACCDSIIHETSGIQMHKSVQQPRTSVPDPQQDLIELGILEKFSACPRTVVPNFQYHRTIAACLLTSMVLDYLYKYGKLPQWTQHDIGNDASAYIPSCNPYVNPVSISFCMFLSIICFSTIGVISLSPEPQS